MLSADESDSLNDKSDNDGSDSGSSGICAFTFRFEGSVSMGPVDDSVGRVCGAGFGVFVSTGIESTGDAVPLVVSVPIGVESKVSGLIELFWRPKS